jgi:hypothetical protein
MSRCDFSNKKIKLGETYCVWYGIMQHMLNSTILTFWADEKLFSFDPVQTQHQLIAFGIVV